MLDCFCLLILLSFLVLFFFRLLRNTILTSGTTGHMRAAHRLNLPHPRKPRRLLGPQKSDTSEPSACLILFHPAGYFHTCTHRGYPPVHDGNILPDLEQLCNSLETLNLTINKLEADSIPQALRWGKDFGTSSHEMYIFQMPTSHLRVYFDAFVLNQFLLRKSVTKEIFFVIVLLMWPPSLKLCIIALLSFSTPKLLSEF